MAVSLPLRDLLLWGLVPFLRTRGYSALPVHFLGKAATFNLLYAFPLLLLGDGEGIVATLAEVFGWAFAIWGIGLYWWAGVLYAWQVRKLLADHRTPGCGARCLIGPPPRSGPTCPAQVTMPLLTLITQQSLDEDYRQVAERRRARASPARGPAAPWVDGRGDRRRVRRPGRPRPPCRPRATPTSTTRAGPP